ncbi:MAG: hypothetical protein ABI653_07850, partial [Bacteroidota bacterium]
LGIFPNSPQSANKIITIAAHNPIKNTRQRIFTERFIVEDFFNLLVAIGEYYFAKKIISLRQPFLLR